MISQSVLNVNTTASCRLVLDWYAPVQKKKKIYH